LLYKHINIKIYRIIIFLVLYGCETWSLTLREERRPRAFEDRMLRRIFGPKAYEVTGEWRKLHNEDTQYCWGDQIEKNEMSGACSTYGERREYRVLVGKPERNRPLGRPRSRWEEDNNVELQEVRCGCMD
jgi:hypothetical protein